MPNVDLDAAKREAAQEPIKITLGGQVFELPPELPISALEPLFGDALADVVGIITAAVSGNTSTQDFAGVLRTALTNNPRLPVSVVEAIRDCLALLFGEQQWTQFLDAGASVQDFLRLVPPLAAAYGAGLGEALGSLGGSTTGGPTSKRTVGRAVSTRGGSGPRRARRAS